ncbi:transcriptional regulator [Rubidibacter lacunae KORDI 51-2]|uniref:Transcriptional regulator n=1 Tax=Rubidibacter lacunae KORDI 51-2 TaxID=582515 RepID=U5DRE1_9CHRO|nr:GntR family transcriptional regulator [Rubidibacter lacunae]ERN42265.1 transcriptional regulator [Rubidibacter lacunae KORDI 51-2]
MTLERQCMSDRVRQVLLERIMDGTYKPGDRLVELQIARELNTSQAPVREALRELEVLSLVESQAYKGTRVRAVTPRELQESLQVRTALEALAAELAAPKFHANPAPLQSALAALQDASARGDTVEHARCDLEFHRAILETAGNQVLLRMWDMLACGAWTRPDATAGNLQSDELTALANEHSAIVRALARGDGRGAGDLLAAHFQTDNRHRDRRSLAPASEPSE